jgi:hypothetical protein
MLDQLPPIGTHQGDTRGRRMRGLRDVPQDLRDLVAGRLDPLGFINGFRRQHDPVEVKVWSGPKLEKLGFRAGVDNINDRRFRSAIREIRRSHNLRVTQGRDAWQRLVMFGDITANASGYTGVSGTATSAPSATTLTNSAAAFPTSGGLNGSLQGHVVVCPAAGVYGTILSNTGTVLTVDQWTALNSATGAAGTTPSNGAVYAIIPGGSLALWIGLSTNSAAAAAGDVLRTADGLFGDGTTSGAATEQTGSGLARAFVQPTFPSAGNIQLQFTWTYTGSSTVVVAKGVLCNSLAAAGSLLFLETLLSSTATVNSNGDQLQLTWSIGL